MIGKAIVDILRPMKNIYISSSTFCAPQAETIEQLHQLISSGKAIDFDEMDILGSRKVEMGYIDFDKEDPDFPHPKKLKVMRPDVVAGVVAIKRLMRQCNLQRDEMLDVPIYVANGVCLDGSTDGVMRVTSAYLPQDGDKSIEDANRRIEKVVSPLFPLTVLSNAALNYVAEESGCLGDNTTFGNTSFAFHDALKAAIRKIETSEAEMAVVGAVNGCGLISVLSNSNLIADKGDWRESVAGGFILLESEKSLERRGAKPLAQIISIDSECAMKDLLETRQIGQTKDLSFEFEKDHGVYSGAFSKIQHGQQGRGLS